MSQTKKNVKRILYLGLDPTRFGANVELVHSPIIRVVKRPFQDVKKTFAELPKYTHILFTSRTTISIFFEYVPCRSVRDKMIIVLGKATAAALLPLGLSSHVIAEDPTSEGVVSSLKKLSLKDATIFFPHSALTRSVIKDYLRRAEIRYCSFPLYTIEPRSIPNPDISSFDEIWFTSPSTIDAYLTLFSSLPPLEKCKAIGPITAAHLAKKSK